MVKNSDKYKVSFRIIREDLDPIEITEMLGINPDKSHAKGDKISSKTKGFEDKVYDKGQWSLDSKCNDEEALEEHIKNILYLLEPKRDKILHIKDRGCLLDFFCGYFFENSQPGFEISSELLRRIGDLGIDLGICIYDVRVE